MCPSPQPEAETLAGSPRNSNFSSMDSVWLQQQQQAQLRWVLYAHIHTLIHNFFSSAAVNDTALWEPNQPIRHIPICRQ